MDEHIARQWVEALRSGVYKQGELVLRDTDEKYCCLGVLCDMSKQGKWIESPNGYVKDHQEEHPNVYGYSTDRAEWWDDKSEYGIITKEVRDWAGMKSTNGELPYDGNDSLSAMNDRGMSFADIADVIEKNWEVL